jgi:hypothetical protein
MTYQLNSSLAALFDSQYERLLKTGLGLVEGEEGLVRSLRCLVLGGCQEQFERVGRAELDLLAERCFGRQPGCNVSVSRSEHAST